MKKLVRVDVSDNALSRFHLPPDAGGQENELNVSGNPSLKEVTLAADVKLMPSVSVLRQQGVQVNIEPVLKNMEVHVTAPSAIPVWVSLEMYYSGGTYAIERSLDLQHWLQVRSLYNESTLPRRQLFYDVELDGFQGYFLRIRRVE